MGPAQVSASIPHTHSQNMTLTVSDTELRLWEKVAFISSTVLKDLMATFKMSLCCLLLFAYLLYLESHYSFHLRDVRVRVVPFVGQCWKIVFSFCPPENELL